MAVQYRQRVRVALYIMAGIGLLMSGLALQHRWDAACAAEEAGTRWDPNLWMCVRAAK